jgi:hypothetical protein
MEKQILGFHLVWDAGNGHMQEYIRNNEGDVRFKKFVFGFRLKKEYFDITTVHRPTVVNVD